MQLALAQEASYKFEAPASRFDFLLSSEDRENSLGTRSDLSCTQLLIESAQGVRGKLRLDASSFRHTAGRLSSYRKKKPGEAKPLLISPAFTLESLHVLCLKAFRPPGHIELYSLAFLQATEAVAADGPKSARKRFRHFDG